MLTISNSLAAFFATATLILGTTAFAADESAVLPDSPGFLMQAAASGPASATTASPIYPGTRPYLHRVVKPDMGPQPLTAGQKLEMSLIAPYSLIGFATNVVTSGESFLADSRPHYGTDRAGYGERLGAAEIKSIDENFLSYGLFPAIFREDPHYYIMGSSHTLKSRIIYSGSRIVLTRRDSGGTGINFSKLLGLAGSQALTNTYYPDRDRGVQQTITAYFSNIGTSAAVLELNEFLPDVLKAVRHKKQ